MSYSACPNCGNPKFEEHRKDFECPSCGFKKTETKQLPEVTLMFCEDCGCHYTDGCSLHPKSRQRKAKF